MAIQTWEDEQLAMLRPYYPGWDIWFVRHFMGPGCWAARPKGAPVATINVYSPEELAKAIGEQERERAAS